MIYIIIGTTVGIDNGTGSLTREQKRYQQAMDFLSTKVEGTGMNIVELYNKKQIAYTTVCSEKAKAFAEALEKAKASSSSNAVAQEHYEQWVQENAQLWRHKMQAAYMDWVITGRKQEVEYWFSIVDQDSAMARVEASKVRLRICLWMLLLADAVLAVCRKQCAPMWSKTSMAVTSFS